MQLPSGRKIKRKIQNVDPSFRWDDKGREIGCFIVGWPFGCYFLLRLSHSEMPFSVNSRFRPYCPVSVFLKQSCPNK
jgi:hypothetical protein